MSREMIVGGEHLVGHQQRHHDYDELMELGGEPARHHPTPAAPPPVPMLPMHAQQQPVHHQHQHPHHHHHGAHPQHDEYGRPLVLLEGYAHPPPPLQHYASHPHQHHPHHEEPPHMSQPQRKRLVAEEPTHERQFPIGFIKENIAPNVEEDIEVKPQVYFRGERLALPPTIARYFDVMDIKVGKDSQLAATGSMPGESFSALAVGVRMELDTAKPGIVITLRVRNVDTVPHDFKAVLYGAVLE